MPIDFEMILSASPPVFSTASFMDFGFGHFRGPHHNRHNFNNDNYDDIRSCLLSPRSDSDEYSREGAKKRVWFADDKGLALTHVKVMSEPSNCPPKWTDEFLAQVVKGVKPNPIAPEVQWTVQFPQPASDYLAFRDKLQKNCVSLENVIVREGDDTIKGTIKVKNLTFDKEVFVRVTFDQWASVQDVPATFNNLGVESGSSQYDTFSFSLSVPPSAVKYKSIEFCVCFKCSGTEYWDNNDGNNYVLSSVDPETPDTTSNYPRKVNDALQVNINAWSEFASWNHLITEGPYW